MSAFSFSFTGSNFGMSRPLGDLQYPVATLTALAQILALEPVALYWPTEGAGWQGRTGGDLSAVGSPVGILPDLSELGGATLDEWLANPTTPELVDTANDAAAWGLFGSNTVTNDAGAVKVTYVNDSRGARVFLNATGGLSEDLTDGKTYVATMDMRVSAGATVRAQISSSATLIISDVTSTTYVSLNIVFPKVAALTPFLQLTEMASGEEAWIDNISVRELPGIHAIAPTDAARPLLGRVPVTGRRNLLTYSEQFDQGVWSKFANTTVTANVAVAPDGTTTADKVIWGNGATTGGAVSFASTDRGTATNPIVAFTLSGAGTATIGSALAAGSNYGITALSDGWYLCWLYDATANQTLSVRAKAGEFNRIQLQFYAGQRYIYVRDSVATAGDGTSGIYLWGAQLELGSTATEYQKVVTALDVTEAGVADTYYVNHDGVDDHFALSSSIPITEEMTVVRAFGRSAAGISSVGLAAAAPDNAPHEALWLTTNSFQIGRLSASTSPTTTSSASTATGAFVTTARRNATIENLRNNGVEVATIAANPVTGALAVLGQRNTFYNNGPISFLAVFDRELTGDELALVENIAAGTNGATLA